MQRGLSSSNRWLKDNREFGPLLGHTLSAPLPLLLQPTGKQLLVFLSLCLSLGNPKLLLSNFGPLPLEGQQSYQPLYFRSFANLLSLFISKCPAVCVDILPDIIFLGQVED
ncbi:unnamed protein product [Cuscuta epithymum]|uniref:Uncharacterized protein n=1 Tax=Cuscuta epithymum TaxID=186058 RepID=A0AAV0EE92_9ASTE|nr:unnamed protein product [Cuscuta epithymum]